MRTALPLPDAAEVFLHRLPVPRQPSAVRPGTGLPSDVSTVK